MQDACMQHHDECLLLAPPCQANVPTLDLKPGHQAFIFLPVDLHAAQHGTDGLYRAASLQWEMALAGCCELWSLGGRLAAWSGLREADLLHGLAKVALAMLYRPPHLAHVHFAMQLICQFLPYWSQRLQRGSRRDWTARVAVGCLVMGVAQRFGAAAATPGSGCTRGHRCPASNCRCLSLCGCQNWHLSGRSPKTPGL